MDGVRIGKVGKSVKSQTDKESKDQDEEQLCKSMINGLARRNREKHAILAEVGEEEQRIKCIDDVASEALPLDEGRQAREQELENLRDLGVFEDVDEREAIAQY